MKKILSILICIVMLSSALSSCAGDPGSTDASPASDEKLSIVCTIFPEYDWLRNIIGEHLNDIELTMLIKSGVDLHNFQPSADDIISVSKCDMFVYVGGESDSWVDDVLATAQNEDMIVVNLLEVLGDSVKEEEMKEGMEAEDEGEEGEEEGPEYDEHVWLSLRNAVTICEFLRDVLCEIDPDGRAEFNANCDKYTTELKALDARYSETVGSSKVKTLVFADRFPFRYMAEDYGLDYYAAFVGCSTESEASFETITFLAKKIKELGLKAVVVIEGAEHKIASSVLSVVGDKDVAEVTMDSMQGITEADVADGTTYVSIMENNLEALNKALAG